MKIKRNSSEEEWWQLFNNPVYPREYIEHKVMQTIDEIKALTNDRKIAMAWSGGKDSIALQLIMEKSELSYDSFIVVSQMEYPEFIKWINDNKPKGLNFVISNHNFEWLASHNDMLFPQDSKTLAKWYKIVQHDGQKAFARSNEIDIMLLGRRKADGNYTGRGANHYQKKTETFVRYCPIADWKHEEVMALLSYEGVDMPPIYSYPNGFRNGTHPIGARPNTTSYDQAYSELYSINPRIVEEMAEYIQSARDYIKEVEQ